MPKIGHSNHHLRERFDYAAVRDLAAPVNPTIPELATPAVPDLRVYDALLVGASR